MSRPPEENYNHALRRRLPWSEAIELPNPPTWPRVATNRA